MEKDKVYCEDCELYPENQEGGAHSLCGPFDFGNWYSPNTKIRHYSADKNKGNDCEFFKDKFAKYRKP